MCGWWCKAKTIAEDKGIPLSITSQGSSRVRLTGTGKVLKKIVQVEEGDGK